MMGISRSAAALAAVALAGGIGPATAHVTASPNEAAAGSYFQSAFTVPHGCSGSPTIAVRIKIPDGVTSVKPQMKPGWQIEIKNRKLDTPIDAGHGRMISETVDEVAWRGGSLPDIYYDTFGLVMKLPDDAGKTLYFPVVQECKEGVHRWITIPADGEKWHEAKEPAPFIKLKKDAH
jgi:uncharacterized protein YcnI